MMVDLIEAAVLERMAHGYIRNICFNINRQSGNSNAILASPVHQICNGKSLSSGMPIVTQRANVVEAGFYEVKQRE